MIKGHPSDKMLQQYIDDSSLYNRNEIKEHLKSCVICQRQVEVYMSLNKYLKVESQEKFSDDFENRIIAAIEKTELKPVAHNPLVFAALIFLAGILCYLFLVPGIREILINSFIVTYEAILNLNFTFARGNSFLSTTLYIILFSFFVFSLFGIPNWKKLFSGLSGSKK